MSFDLVKNVPFAKADAGAGSGGQYQHIVEAQAGADQLVMPDGFALLMASFERVGADLVLTAPDGTIVFIQGYFDLASPPALMTQGGAMITGDLASALAGPVAPGQYAQADGALEVVPIGQVSETAGEIRVTHADGSQDTLTQDSSVFQGDILETGEGAAISITFVDETAFSLGENGRMVLDELIFDAETLEGSSTFSVIQGVFVFVSGEIAANNPDEMIVRTPVATIGVRGTKVGGQAAQEGELNTVVLFPKDNTDGEPSGAITFQTIGAELDGEEPLVISQAYRGASVSSVFDSPTSIVIEPDLLAGLFNQISNALPQSPLLNTLREALEENEEGAGGAEQSSSNAQSLSEIAPAAGGEAEDGLGDAEQDPEFETAIADEELFAADLLGDLEDLFGDGIDLHPGSQEELYDVEVRAERDEALLVVLDAVIFEELSCFCWTQHLDVLLG